MLTHKSHIKSELNSVFPGHPSVLKRRHNHDDSILHFLVMEFLDGLANWKTVLKGKHELLIMLTDHYFTGLGESVMHAQRWVM